MPQITAMSLLSKTLMQEKSWGPHRCLQFPSPLEFWYPRLLWVFPLKPLPEPRLCGNRAPKGSCSDQSDTKAAVEKFTMELRWSRHHTDCSTSVPPNTWVKKMSQGMTVVKASYQHGANSSVKLHTHWVMRQFHLSLRYQTCEQSQCSLKMSSTFFLGPFQISILWICYFYFNAIFVSILDGFLSF